MTLAAKPTPTIHRLSRYLLSERLRDGSAVTLWPLILADESTLPRFCDRLPEENRFYQRKEVMSPGVIHAWCAGLNYDCISSAGATGSL